MSASTRGGQAVPTVSTGCRLPVDTVSTPQGMVPAMTDYRERKSLKVSTPVHARVHQVATELGRSAHEAIALLVSPSTVCLPLSTEQHERWTAYADAAGIPLATWIEHRIEAAIQYGTDQGTMAEVLKGVRLLLARTAPPQPAPRRPLKEK